MTPMRQKARETAKRLRAELRVRGVLVFVDDGYGIIHAWLDDDGTSPLHVLVDTMEDEAGKLGKLVQ
jgi:hypothetical protein